MINDSSRDIDSYFSEFHVGRSWEGSPLEAICPCVKEACGLVGKGVDQACDQHGFKAQRTLRQIHWEANCPAVTVV